jgi:chromosome segregation ATPase
MLGVNNGLRSDLNKLKSENSSLRISLKSSEESLSKVESELKANLEIAKDMSEYYHYIHPKESFESLCIQGKTHAQLDPNQSKSHTREIAEKEIQISRLQAEKNRLESDIKLYKKNYDETLSRLKTLEFDFNSFKESTRSSKGFSESIDSTTPLRYLVCTPDILQ